MDGSDTSRELLENVTMAEVSPPYMMQRIGVEPSQLLSSELLPSHSGLVVDMTNTEYLPTVSYAADDLLGHDLTEEDRNLAAALVAVQLVQQQKQQQLHQDSNVIVSTSSLASLVTTSHLENGKVELSDQQLVISSADKPVISSINNTFLNAPNERHLHHESLPSIKKYSALSINSHDDYTNEAIKEEYIAIKNESEQHTEESLQLQRDSDCENRNEVRPSKKSLPHKKRISRKLKKNCPVSRKAHKCTVCDQVLNSTEELATHSACHSINVVVQPNPFSCQICGILCNDQLTFFEHLKTHYEPSLATAQVKENGLNTLRTEEPKDSLLSSLLPPLNCIHCGKHFRRQKAFEAHMRDIHNKVEDEFSEPEDLMEGIRSVVEANDRDSSEEGPDSKVWYREDDFQPTASDLQELEGQGQICHLCGQVFSTNEEVMQHLQECKSNVETKLEQSSDSDVKSRSRKKRRKTGQLFCPHCDRVFCHRNSLMYHMRGHTGERPHQCDICGKSFFAASALKVHMRLHSGDKPYKCEFCGRHFRQWGDLKYHCISIHSDQKQYQCEYCGKDFARKYSLIVHRRIHTGEKNYRCEFCGKTFRASSYLQNHRRIHTGEKPHPCEVCGKPFRVRSDMKRHLITHSRRRNTGPAPRITTTTTAVISVRDADVDAVESIVPDTDEGILEAQELQADTEEPVSEESVQYPRDPLETVRDGANTLFNSGHQLFICYPSELPTRATMETHWIQTDN